MFRVLKTGLLPNHWIGLYFRIRLQFQLFTALLLIAHLSLSQDQKPTADSTFTDSIFYNNGQLKSLTDAGHYDKAYKMTGAT